MFGVQKVVYAGQVGEPLVGFQRGGKRNQEANKILISGVGISAQLGRWNPTRPPFTPTFPGLNKAWSLPQESVKRLLKEMGKLPSSQARGTRGTRRLRCPSVGLKENLQFWGLQIPTRISDLYGENAAGGGPSTAFLSLVSLSTFAACKNGAPRSRFACFTCLFSW